jgi:hypothetical protein
MNRRQQQKEIDDPALPLPERRKVRKHGGTS